MTAPQPIVGRVEECSAAKRRLGVFRIAAMAMAIVAAASRWTGASAAPNVPRLDATPCSAALARISNVTCYTLVVPENRSTNTARTISIPIVVRRALNGPPHQSHALFFSIGGPGSDTMFRIERRVQGIPLVRTHDVVWFEQRGLAAATPPLTCSEYSNARLEILEHNLSRDDAERTEFAAATRCRQRLVGSGIDLSAYNTREIARDLIDLSGLLGYKMDLYGLSYSATVMLEVLKLRPDLVRSAYLDSTLPPDVSIDEVGIANQYRAFDAVFSDCEADLECRRAFKGSSVVFRKLLAALTLHPVAVTLKTPEGQPFPFEINGRAAFDALSNILYDPDQVGTIPKTVFSASRGDYSALIGAIQGNISPSFFAWGQRLSVWCHDFAPLDDSAAVAKEDSLYSEVAGLVAETVPAPVCKAWNVGNTSTLAQGPFTSSVPALIYGGEYDPNIPPAWEAHVASSFPNSTVIVFQGRSHGAGETPCGWQMFDAFVTAPSNPIDVRCVSQLGPAKFVL